MGFNLFNSIFRVGFGVCQTARTLSKLYFGGDNCLQFVIVVFPDHTHLLFLCDIIFMHYVLNIIYQLYGEDNTSILTF